MLEAWISQTSESHKIKPGHCSFTFRSPLKHRQTAFKDRGQLQGARRHPRQQLHLQPLSLKRMFSSGTLSLPKDVDQKVHGNTEGEAPK